MLKYFKINGFIRLTFEPNISIDIIKKYFTKLKNKCSNQIEFFLFYKSIKQGYTIYDLINSFSIIKIILYREQSKLLS